MTSVGIAAKQPSNIGCHFSSEERDTLILQHLAQVRIIARRIYERLPVSVSLDDLISAGTMGLIAAIDRFNPKRDVQLKTFAEYKIRGAILDSLREMDWAPRQQRKRSKLIETAIAALEQKLKRSPKEEEIAAHLNISMAQYYTWLSKVKGLNLGSLESGGSEDEGQDLLSYTADAGQVLPSEILERTELERLVATGIRHMPKLEQTVLSLYFYDDLTLREISSIVGLHESRISQLKSQSILRLRALLRKRWDSAI